MNLSVYFCTIKNKWLVEASTSRYASLFIGEGDTKEDAIYSAGDAAESLNRQLYELEQEIGVSNDQ